MTQCGIYYPKEVFYLGNPFGEHFYSLYLTTNELDSIPYIETYLGRKTRQKSRERHYFGLRVVLKSHTCVVF